MKPLLSLLLLFSLIACKSSKSTVEEFDPAVYTFKSEEEVISMKKGGCYGTCPIYDVIVYSDRSVKYRGKKFVDKNGIYAKVLSKENYKNLVSSFDEANFHEFQDFYESNIADLPEITLSYTKKKVKKTIKGKRERPEALHKLEFLLEQIVEGEGWTFISTIDKDTPTKINKAQIVVDIANGSQLSNWFRTVKDKFGIQILQRMDDGSDSWLIGFDPRLHKPEDVLMYLKADPSVKSAEFKVEKVQN